MVTQSSSKGTYDHYNSKSCHFEPFYNFIMFCFALFLFFSSPTLIVITLLISVFLFMWTLRI